MPALVGILQMSGVLSINGIDISNVPIVYVITKLFSAFHLLFFLSHSFVTPIDVNGQYKKEDKRGVVALKF